MTCMFQKGNAFLCRLAGVLFATSILLSGCATVPTATLQNAASLAKAGEAASLQMETSLTISQKSLDLYRKAVAFNDGFNSAPASVQLEMNMASIEQRLTQYRSLVQSLFVAYSAMDSLAEYGGATGFDSAITGLSASVSRFGDAVGKPVHLSAGLQKGIQEGGNLLVGSIQVKKLVTASRAIDGSLKQVIAILSDPTVRAAIVPIKGEMQGVVGQAAEILYSKGVYSYGPILNQFGAPFGLHATAKADQAVRANKRLQAGLFAVVNETVNSQVARSKQTYDLELGALRALVAQHTKFEKGEPISLQNLAGIVSNLQALTRVHQSAGAEK